MKTKYALVILIIGFAVGFVGALFKIMHWPLGNILLTTAIFLQIIGCLTFLYKLVTYPKIKDFLNW